ncbi:LysE family transporter [Tepidibacter sp. Z1-5]|uniref:LysE family transporter n=1 Tax=Tepidibacter sp. Z1-5 TaxID=3134138 RepID=UPI0030C356EC
MSIFITGFLLSLSLCLDLGIVNVATIKNGIERGFVPALFIGLGAGVGDMIYAVLSLFGLSIVLDNIFFRWFFWIGGTLILLYMCFNMIRLVIKPKEINELIENKENISVASTKDFLYGIALALASPSSILWFATIGGSVIASTNTNGKSSISLFFIGFFVASEIWSTFIAFLSSRGSRHIGLKLMRSCSVLSSILFLYFAIKIFIEGYNNLLM